MKTTIFKKVLSLFILLGFIFIFIGCDLGKFGLNLSGDDDDNKQDQPVDEAKADVTKELFEYYYSKLSSSPYSFNLWYSLYQEQNISFVLKDNVIYFVDTSTNKEYVYFNLNDLDNNPLHLTIINSNNTVYVKDSNNNIFTLFTYEIVNVSKEYHVQFFDEGTMLKEITVSANTTLSSAFSKAAVSSTLTKEGFQLVGWYVDRAGRVLSNSEISGYIITGDTKVYAEWQEGEPVAENFVIVSISDGFGKQVTVEVEKGTSLAKVLQNNGFDLSPTHAGYRFDFWKVGDTYVESSRANRYYINSNTFILAQWFDPSGGVKINVHYYDGINDFTVEFPIDTAINDFFNQYNIPSQDIKNNPNYNGVLVNGKEIYPYGYTDFILFEDCEITILWKNNNNNDNFIVVIDDNFGNTIQLDYQSPVKASDALKRNGFDVSISHEGYNFLGWEIDGQLVRTGDLYGYELSRGNSSVEYVVHRITAKWEKIVSNKEDVSVLVSPTILNEGTYNVLLTNDYLVFNKTSAGNDWDCIVFPFKENVDYNAYDKLYIRFKGTAGERVLFKINDRYETYVDGTGVEQDIYLDINFEFDYSRYALVVFAKPAASGSSGNCYIYQMNLTNKEQPSECIDAENHVFSDWRVIKEATETEEGIKERHCTVCGYSVQESFIKNEVLNELERTNTVIDFSDGVVATPYDNPIWTREKYTNSWETIEGNMNCREKEGVKVVNFVSGYSIPYRYTYNKDGESLGFGDQLFISFGNYFTDADIIPIKIFVTGVNGEKEYVFGDENNYYNVPVTYGLNGISNFFNPMEVQSITILCKSNLNRSAYLYVSNISLLCADFYVDNSFVGSTKGEIISTQENHSFHNCKLIYGINAFSSINDALDNAKDGNRIFVSSGTYDEDLVINNEIYLAGANLGREAYDFRFNETILTGSIVVAADNVGFEGFTIRCGIKLAKEEINSFDYCNNILDISDSSTYYLTYESDYQTRINDLVITGNYCSNAKSYFFFKLAVVNNLLFLDNRFVPNEYGYVYDYLCIDKYIIGDVTINNNHFEKCIQGAIRILGVGALNMEIRDNTFIDVASTCIDTRIMYDEVAGPVFIDIIHNTFDQSGYSWRCIRTRNTNYGDNTLDVQVHYNAFLNGCYTEVNGVKTYANNPNGDDVIYNMDNNYFAEVPASDVSNDNFAGTASSWNNCYDSVEDLERAYAALNN